jgi:hypothetical protein
MSEHESPTSAENREFALTVLARIQENTGLQLRPLFESDLTAEEIRSQVNELIVAYVEQGVSLEKPTPAWPKAGGTVDVRAALFGGAATNVVPNVAVIEQRYEEVKGYHGPQIDAYLRRITNGLSLLKNGMSPGEAATDIVLTGLASFGAAMIWGTFSALAGGAALLPALAAGIAAMGSMTVVIGVALVIVAQILLFFLVFNKKIFLGMFFNNTDLSLSVGDWRAGTGGAFDGDLFMNTGSMTSFMETHETEYFDSPLVQVTARMLVAPGDADNLICAGIFCAEKKIGFYGTEGVMLFNSKEMPDLRFAFLFACPYIYHNGINVMIGPPYSASSYFERLYERRGMNQHAFAAGFHMEAKAGSPWGGEACGFATLDQA